MAKPVPESVISTASVRGHPVHPMLVPLPIGFLVGVLLSDIGYMLAQTAFWAEASRWLLLAGVITGALAAIPGFIDFFTIRYVRTHNHARLHMIGNVLALILSLVNLFNRPDSQFGVPGSGLALSALVVLIFVGTGWLGGELTYRYRVGVLPVTGETERPEGAERVPAAAPGAVTGSEA
jgi:uncharacterized membrane protein